MGGDSHYNRLALVMIYGVTGTHRLLTEDERAYVHRIVKRTVLPNRRRNVLVSGMAFGVDTEAILAVWGLLPFENIIAVVPGTAPHNYKLVTLLKKEGAHVIQSPTLYTNRETYLRRDDVTVSHLKTLLAFPQRPTFYRSGTWATINKAKAANKRVRKFPLCNA